MKTRIVVLSIFVLFAVTFVLLVNDNSRNLSYLASKRCEMTPYSCYTPPVNFASLH